MPERKELLEIFGVYALICLFGWHFNSGNWAFIGLAFHPYLAVIVILGSFRGSPESSTIAASLVASFLYLAGSLQERPPDAEPGNAGLFILAFVATGLTLGLAQRAGHRKMKTFNLRLNQSFQTREQLRRKVGILESDNETLNDQIQGQLVTPYSFSEMAYGLSILDERDLYSAMCDAVCRYIPAQAASFYILNEEEELVEMARAGPDYRSSPSAPDPTLLKFALFTRVAVTRLDLDLLGKDRYAGNSPLICAPVLHQQTGTPMGVLCIEKLLFVNFNHISKKSLGALANFAAGALSNARRRDAVRAQALSGFSCTE